MALLALIWGAALLRFGCIENSPLKMPLELQHRLQEVMVQRARKEALRSIGRLGLRDETGGR